MGAGMRRAFFSGTIMLLIDGSVIRYTTAQTVQMSARKMMLENVDIACLSPTTPGQCQPLVGRSKLTAMTNAHENRTYSAALPSFRSPP